MSYAFPHSAGQSRKAARARACCIEFRRLVRGLDCGSVRPRQERTLLSKMVLKRTSLVRFKCIMSGPSCRFRTWDFASDRSEAKSYVHAVWYTHPVHPAIMLKTARGQPPSARYPPARRGGDPARPAGNGLRPPPHHAAAASRITPSGFAPSNLTPCSYGAIK